MPAVAALARAINELCVSVPPRPPFPPGGVCFRGGGFDERYRSFFVARRQFREPAFLVTSFSQDTADEFMARSSMPSKVRWMVWIDPTRKCNHVNLVTKRVPGLPDEQEYLFAPYSAFTVLSVAWNAGTDAEPHVIELLAGGGGGHAARPVVRTSRSIHKGRWVCFGLTRHDAVSGSGPLLRWCPCLPARPKTLLVGSSCVG